MRIFMKYTDFINCSGLSDSPVLLVKQFKLASSQVVSQWKKRDKVADHVVIEAMKQDLITVEQLKEFG